MANTLPQLIFENIDSDATRLDKRGGSMSSGKITKTVRLYFKVPPNQNPRAYNDNHVWTHPNFPGIWSRWNKNSNYRFEGNAQIQENSLDSSYFIVDVEYVWPKYASDGSGSKDKNAKDLAPWKLPPTDVQFSFPEEKVSFRKGYMLGTSNAVVPVVNSAGDYIIAEKIDTLTEVSLNYAVRATANIENMRELIGSINSSTIDIENVYTFKPRTGKIVNLALKRQQVMDDVKPDVVKWSYWDVSARIQYNPNTWARKFEDMGDRAKFNNISLQDECLTTLVTLTGTQVPSPICCFRKAKKVGADFYPGGDMVYCSWDQFLAARALYLAKSQNKYSLQCEQLHQIPLSSGYVNTTWLQNPSPTNLVAPLEFYDAPTKSWTGLRLP